jgi:hypothetical protein
MHQNCTICTKVGRTRRWTWNPWHGQLRRRSPDIALHWRQIKYPAGGISLLVSLILSGDPLLSYSLQKLQNDLNHRKYDYLARGVTLSLKNGPLSSQKLIDFPSKNRFRSSQKLDRIISKTRLSLFPQCPGSYLVTSIAEAHIVMISWDRD